jgi:hypothetical protein
MITRWPRIGIEGIEMARLWATNRQQSLPNRVTLAGFTPYPDQECMEQQARNMTSSGEAREDGAICCTTEMRSSAHPFEN